MLFKLITILFSATILNINITAQNLTEQYNSVRKGYIPYSGANINADYQPDNATTDSNITLIGYLDTGDQARNVAVSGNYAYVADGNDGLRIIDISNPLSPFETGFFDTGGSAYGVTVSGNYVYVADGYDGIYILRPDSSILPILPDFTMELIVSDNCSHTQDLTFGTAPDATECYDPAYDCLILPPPPPGSPGTWFLSCGVQMTCDFRGTNIDSIVIWHIVYQPASGCEPITICWNPSELPDNGNFVLMDDITGTLVNINMREENCFTDVLGLGHLRIVFDYVVSADYNLAEGWNMLSLPLDVPDANYLTLFPNAMAGTLFGFNGSYYSTDTVNTSTGYWLKFPAPEIVDVYGLEITECVIDLDLGWNMIGGPNCSVPLGSVVDPGGIIIPGTLFGYAGGYFTTTSIDATKSYWIKASAPGTITIGCGTLLAKGRDDLTLPLETLTDFGKIEISDKTKSSQTLYFNGKLDEGISIESYSMPPVSPKGSFDARLTGGYRLSESEEVLVEIQSSSYPLKVKIDGKGQKYIVKQFIGTNEIDERIVASGEEITISNSKVNKLSISKGSLIPTKFVLHQNYPNPFNPVTQIKYGIPKAESVELTIFNVLGERIVTLVNEEQEAGYYTVEWSGNNVSSGVYLYTLKAGDNFNVKKMILLK